MSTTSLNTTSTGETLVRERSRTAAGVAVAAILTYWALSIAVVIVNPQWNPLTRQLSEYALANCGWLQVAAFLASAVAYGALAIAAWGQVCGVAGRIGVIILSYCALGSVGVGAFVTDPMTTPPNAMTAHGVLHTAFGGSALILLPVAALLITRNIARFHREASRTRSLLRHVGYLPLAGLALIWIPETGGVIPAGGWPDRILFLTCTIWLLALAAQSRVSTRTGQLQFKEPIPPVSR